MSGPRAGNCADAALEKYLISTVPVPPTNTRDGQTPRLSRVEPASTNLSSGVNVRVEGTLRLTSGSSNAPSIQFRSMDVGKSPTKFSFTPQQSAFIDNANRNGFIGSGGPADIFSKILYSRSGTTEVNSFSSVPRFGIKRTSYEIASGELITDSEWVGVSTNFEKFPVDAAHNELEPGFAGVSGTWTVHGRPRLLETKDGKLQIWHLAKNDSSNYDIVVSQFDPKTQTKFEHLYSLKDSYGSFLEAIAQPEAGVSYYPVGIAPVTLGDSIYCVVCVTNSATGLDESDYDGIGFLYSFKIQGDGIEPVVWSSAESASPSPRAVPLVDIFAPLTDQSGTDPINPRTVFGGIDAVEMNGIVRVAVGVKCNGYCASEDTSTTSQPRVITYLDTPDFQVWGDSDSGGNDRIGPIPRIMSLSGFDQVSDLKVNDFTRVSATIVGSVTTWACGPGGSVYRGRDNGLRWTKMVTGIEPENMKDGRLINLHAIHGYGSTIYAAGDYGTIIRSTDNGLTWLVVASVIDRSEFLFANTTAGTGKLGGTGFIVGSVGNESESSADIYGLFVRQSGAGNTVWACGKQGLVLYSSDSGETWTIIVNWQSSGAYHSIVEYSSGNVLVVGDSNVHDVTDITNLRHRRCRALRITSATTAKSYGDLFASDFQLPPGESDAISDGSRESDGPNSIVRIRLDGVSGVTIAMDESGHTYLGTASGELRYRHRLPIGTSSIIRDMVAPDGSNNLVNNQLIAIEDSGGGKSTIWMTARFRTITDSDAATLYRQLTIYGSGARAISFKDLDVGVAGGIFGISARTTTLPQRARPAMLRLPSGETMLVCINLNTGDVEQFIFADEGAAPKKVGNVTRNIAIASAMVDGSFAFDDSLEMSSTYVPTPALTIDESKQVLMCWGHKRTGYSDTSPVSPQTSNYRSWFTGSHPLVDLPLGQFPVITGYPLTAINPTRDTKWFSRGRLFSTCVSSSNKIGVFVARDFRDATTENPTNFVPITPGSFQWSGVNDIMVKFSGLPVAGDEYTVEPIWSYSTTNLAIETPSIEWRSASVSGGVDVPETVLLWDRLDSDVVTAMGLGSYWDVISCALFGKNFQEFELAMSSDAGFTAPISAQSMQILQSGTATSFEVGGQITSIIKDASATMVPSQYKSGAGKKFYLKVAVGSAQGNVYEIVDNDRQAIFIKNASSLGSSFTYQIFSDRTFVDLADAATDEQRYTARYLKITIPAQKTVDGYFKIGKPILGKYVTYTPYTGNESRRKFSEGFGWRPIPSTVLQRGDSGVSSVEHLGFQRAWTLPYDQMQWWDRDMQLNGLLPAMRQAFAIQFSPNDDNQLYLVRLNDGPQVTNTVQDRYSYSLQLEEVV